MSLFTGHYSDQEKKEVTFFRRRLDMDHDGSFFFKGFSWEFLTGN